MDHKEKTKEQCKENTKDKILIQLQQKAQDLPRLPGCYLMKNNLGQTIYVGKAKELKSRVISYFNASAKNLKTEVLVKHIVDFDFVITESETAALVLENNLIKKHSPKYNIRLKDDKSYPYVVIKEKEPFPRLEYLRRVKQGSDTKIFGPFVTGSNISEVLRTLTKGLGLRDCSVEEFKKRKEPCLLYQMKQCLAPCVQKVELAEYEVRLDFARKFFLGKPKSVLNFFSQEMNRYSDAQEYEMAARVRDSMTVLEKFLENTQQKNAELFSGIQNIDVLAFYAGKEEIDLGLYMVRNGLLIGHKNFHFSSIDCQQEIDEEVLSYFLQYYTLTNDSAPELIIAPFESELLSRFNQALIHFFKYENVQVKKVEKKYESLAQITFDYAYEQQRVRLSNESSVFVGLIKLQELLKLSERPIVLECYDVAIWQGDSPTASQIVFHDGKPDKKSYRYYHLETRPEGNNDFAMIQEVVLRRVKNGNLPDVFIVDGGKGQVSAFLQALKESKINIPVVGIAKSRTTSEFQSDKITQKEERLFIPGRANPYILKSHMSLYRIITQMRDEAHRFSRKLHHKSEKKRLFG